MKTLIAALLVLTLSACETNAYVDGQKLPLYGFANKETADKCVNYELSTFNIVGAVIFSESIVIPAFVGLFWLWRPISKKPNCKSES